MRYSSHILRELRELVDERRKINRHMETLIGEGYDAGAGPRMAEILGLPTSTFYSRFPRGRMLDEHSRRRE